MVWPGQGSTLPTRPERQTCQLYGKGTRLPRGARAGSDDAIHEPQSLNLIVSQRERSIGFVEVGVWQFVTFSGLLGRSPEQSWPTKTGQEPPSATPMAVLIGYRPSSISSSAAPLSRPRFIDFGPRPGIGTGYGWPASAALPHLPTDSKSAVRRRLLVTPMTSPYRRPCPGSPGCQARVDDTRQFDCCLHRICLG